MNESPYLIARRERECFSKENAPKLIGKKFNYLTIVSLSEPQKRKDGFNNTMVYCLCDCGINVVKNFSYVIRGKVKSCGCKKTNLFKTPYVKTHGLSDHPVFEAYEGMMRRCYKETCKTYKNYGGRGITVCNEWKNDKNVFFDWAFKNGYEKGLQLDRRENNLGYYPGNCRFVTSKINVRNRRTTLFIIHNGEKRALAEWCEIFKLEYNMCLERVRRGWNAELTFSKPFRSRLNNKERKICGIIK